MRRILLILAAAIIVVVASAQLDSLPDYAEKWPAVFHNTFMRTEAWQWCGLGFLLVICLITAQLTRFVFKRITFLRDRLAAQQMTDGTRAFVSRAAGLMGGALMANALLPDLQVIQLEHRLENLVDATILVASVLLVYGWWDVLCDSLTARALGHRRAEGLLVPITRKLMRAVIIVVGVLIGLAMFVGTKTLTGLAAGLGLGGVVIALAAKDSVENVFASLTIMFDMPFAMGDWIKMEKAEGAIEEINLRSTRLRTADDTIITMPNANLIRAPVENFGARRTRRQRMNIRLSWDCDPKVIDAFCESLRNYLEEQPQVEKGRTTVELDDPSETSVGVVVIWFLDVSSATEEATARHAFLDEALRQRTSHDVNFAAPLPANP